MHCSYNPSEEIYFLLTFLNLSVLGLGENFCFFGLEESCVLSWYLFAGLIFKEKAHESSSNEIQ